MYGPHIGVDDEGEVGSYVREGQEHKSTACGALIAAYNSCVAGKHGKDYEDALDMQQNWLREKILPHTAWIQSSPNPMAALARISYEIVRNKMMGIVNTNFGKGKLILLGGIQINTPAGFEDHFLPYSFEMLCAGKQTVDLLDTFHVESFAAQL